MELRTRDKKKEQMILLFTIIGIVLVLGVWAIQLRGLFTQTLAQERTEISNEYAQTIEEMEAFQKDMDAYLPDMSESFNALLQQAQQEQARREQEEQALQVQTMDEIAQEMVSRLEESAVESEESQEGDNQE